MKTAKYLLKSAMFIILKNVDKHRICREEQNFWNFSHLEKWTNLFTWTKSKFFGPFTLYHFLMGQKTTQSSLFCLFEINHAHTFFHN